MKKKILIHLFVCIAFMSACSVNHNVSNDNYITEEFSNFENNTDETISLPAYNYTGTNPQMKAISQFTADMLSSENESVVIPTPIVFLCEIENNGLIKVYGNFWCFSYELNGTTLECVSGGEFPGVLYLKQDGNSYVVDSFDKVRDGSYYTKDIKRICAGNQSLEQQYYNSVDANKNPLRNMRIRYIKDYVSACGLDIDSYKDYGQEPVMLSEIS